jgi:hypothetical protein
MVNICFGAHKRSGVYAKLEHYFENDLKNVLNQNYLCAALKRGRAWAKKRAFIRLYLGRG